MGAGDELAGFTCALVAGDASVVAALASPEVGSGEVRNAMTFRRAVSPAFCNQITFFFQIITMYAQVRGARSWTDAHAHAQYLDSQARSSSISRASRRAVADVVLIQTASRDMRL